MCCTNITTDDDYTTPRKGGNSLSRLTVVSRTDHAGPKTKSIS